MLDCYWTVVPMPINADGNGPETREEFVVRTEWHVWTHDFLGVCVCGDEATAKHLVRLHNKDLAERFNAPN